jgi:cysteine-rich repeat protein
VRSLIDRTIAPALGCALALCAALLPLACSVPTVAFSEVSMCGNGALEPGEECDDGNAEDGDGCDGNCTASRCGNGVATGGEVCDDGNALDTDGCTAMCVAARCGDGLLYAGVEGCDDGANGIAGDGCEASCALSPYTYVKASNTGASDIFGWAVALSADGSTLAVGAYNEASAAPGIDGDQASNGLPGAGAVYVFARAGGAWRQQAYLKASQPGSSDYFGYRVALSADGSRLAVGALLEDSAATGVGGDQDSNAKPDSGAVYVFARTGTQWRQDAYIKASNSDPNDLFGSAVALSADGNTLAVGAYNERSAATGINGDQTGNTIGLAGAAYVFTRAGGAWSQDAYVKASNTGSDIFGFSVALSGDGRTLAVGAYGEASAARGVGGDQLDNSMPSAGAVYVYTRGAAGWSQEAYVKASNTEANDLFGYAVALSGDGATLAVGANLEDGAARAVDGDESSNGAGDAGAAYVFSRAGGAWTQQAYIKASNTDPADRFAFDLSLAADGRTLVVGAFNEASGATGTGGDPADNGAPQAGAVYRFRRSGATWSQDLYAKKPTAPRVNEGFGIAVDVSQDGTLLAVGAYVEDSGATGIAGDPTSAAAINSGAAYVIYAP